jgi:hypothetical protein
MSFGCRLCVGYRSQLGRWLHDAVVAYMLAGEADRVKEQPGPGMHAVGGQSVAPAWNLP